MPDKRGRGGWSSTIGEHGDGCLGRPPRRNGPPAHREGPPGTVRGECETPSAPEGEGSVTTNADVETINVQPHPRLLSVLGDIEFQPWQCLAELIDNSFDEFLRNPIDVIPDPTVYITLPGRRATPRTAEVWVRDNGAGMSLEQLNNAIRAGWTSNDRYGRLGLFGVGFNIATARLGHVAVVRTARVEDESWTTVRLDLRAMAEGASFDLPVEYEPKSATDDHGTVVVIKDLKQEHFEVLTRQQTKIRNVLGDVYSYLLKNRGFRILIDGSAVRPRVPCVWSSERAVVRSGERVPAVIEIDEKLTDRLACKACGTWQDTDNETCAACGSEHVEVRERRIWGWIGIQRYTHKTDFGIDFLRNGRKVLLRDQQIFMWEDPDDPTGRGEVEYPIEVPSIGRIVGEIHADHVGVNYQKNAFEYDTPDWRRVVRIIRGDGPLRPRRAAELGYAPNRSPLALLYAGFRRTNPGLNYLIPGDGRTAIHAKAKEWADLFQKGVPAYQTDEIWYQAAYNHDNPPDEPDAGDDEGEDPTAILRKKGLLPPDPASGQDKRQEGGQPSTRRETEDERRGRWRDGAVPIPDLEGRYGLPGHGAPLEVAVWLVRDKDLHQPGETERLPIYMGAGRGAAVEVFIDKEHPVFVDFAVDTRDLFVFELAEFLRNRDNMPQKNLSVLFYEIKNQCLPDQKVSGAFLQDTATRLIGQVRELMAPVVEGNAAGYWSLLPQEDKSAAERQFALEGPTGSWDETTEEGDWLEYVPATSLVRLFHERPEAFLDGQVFKSSYVGLSDQLARTISVDRVSAYLADVASFSDRPGRRGAEELRRVRLSCILLEQELSASGNETAP